MPSAITSMPGSSPSSPLAGGTPDTASHVADFNAALGQSPSASTNKVDTATSLTGTATADIASLIKQLIPLLQQLATQLSGGAGSGAQGGAPAGEGAGGSAAAKNAPSASAAPHSDAPSSAAPHGDAPSGDAGSNDLNTLIPQLISTLQQALGAKAEAPKAEAPKAEAPKTEAPKTEAPKTEAPKTEAPKTEAPKTEASADGSGQGANTQLASLIKQLITLLQQVLGGASPSQAGSPDMAKTISMVKDLIAQLQTQGAGAPGSSSPAPSPQADGSSTLQQTRSDPSMGISLAEVQAMLNHVNGTGPEVIYADWSAPPSTQPSAAGGQVSGLGSQVGNEAA